jgi:drug/metabolite transporter (DMT)-like permease
VREHRFLFGSLALILAASGFGMLGPVARLAYEAGFEPMAFVAWRAMFGFLAIVAIAAVAARRGIPLVNPLRLPRGDVAGLAAIVVAGLGVNISTFVAFDLTTVALVLLAFYTYPALVAVVAVALGHERLDGTRAVALLLALGGMTLVVAGGLDPARGSAAFNPVGVLLGLLAAVFQTLFVTVSRGRLVAVSAVQVMGWVLLSMTATCILLAAVLGNALDVPLRDGRALGLVLLAGVVGAGLPSVLLLVGIRAIGGTRAGILMLIEALLPIQVLGGAAILAAALLLQRGARGDGRDPVGVPLAERT